MAEIRDLSTTDASNTARFPESQAPSTVNNGARALEGMLARAFEDTIDGWLTTGGTGSAYTLTPNRSWTASATMDNGTEFSVEFHAACADTATLNVDTTDARKIFWPDGTTLSASDILANSKSRVKYNTSLSGWVLMNAPVPAKSVAANSTPKASSLDNRLINGEFRIWQRGPATLTCTDDTYRPDRWYGLSQTAVLEVGRTANPFNGAHYSATFKQIQVAAQRMGAAQIIEGQNCVDLRGEVVCFYGRFKISADQDVRCAILEWTGTEDSVTSDFVLDWTSATYTAGNFFTTTSTTVTAVKEYALPGTSWTDFFITGTLGSSLTNICVMVWTEGTAAQNVTLDLANCGFIRGALPPTKHTTRRWAEELALCQRYYCKSFAPDTAPAQNSGVLAGIYTLMQTVGAAAGQRGYFQPFPVEMRGVPTVTTYNPSATNAQARNIETSADCSATSVGGASALHSARGIFIQWTTAAGSSAGQANGVHYAADVEL